MCSSDLLDLIRDSVLKNFRELLKGALQGKAFRDALTGLRTSLTSMHSASYQRDQAEMKLRYSFQVLRKQVGPYMHALHTVMRTLGRYVVGKISDKLAKYCGRYGFLFKAMNAVLQILGLGDILTKGRMSSVFDFAQEQVQKLATHFEKETIKLEARGKESYASDKGKSSAAEFKETVKEYETLLKNQLVEDAVLHLQKELIEPAVKEYTNRMLTQRFDSMFRDKQVQFNRALGEGAGKASWLARAFQESGLERELRREVQRRDFGKQRNNVWQSIGAGAIVYNCEIGRASCRERV